METSMVALNENERAAAEAVFGERLPLAERYVQHLAARSFSFRVTFVSSTLDSYLGERNHDVTARTLTLRLAV